LARLERDFVVFATFGLGLLAGMIDLLCVLASSKMPLTQAPPRAGL
jgi:hypothetical protein